MWTDIPDQHRVKMPILDRHRDNRTLIAYYQMIQKGGMTDGD